MHDGSNLAPLVLSLQGFVRFHGNSLSRRWVTQVRDVVLNVGCIWHLGVFCLCHFLSSCQNYMLCAAHFLVKFVQNAHSSCL